MIRADLESLNGKTKLGSEEQEKDGDINHDSFVICRKEILLSTSKEFAGAPLFAHGNCWID